MGEPGDRGGCDAETGVCAAGDIGEPASGVGPTQAQTEVIYVGDPMCSWCWGIARTLQQFRRDCLARGVGFRVVVGGLRPGGGDPWDAGFKAFLRHHWEEIGARTGQPFSYGILDWPSFNYDTEPACRAIVAVRPLIGERELEFFEGVQRGFYVDNRNPADPEFYRALCERFGIDFDRFVERFKSPAVARETREEFALNRSWGVRGFPSILARTGQAFHTLAVGFATPERLEQALARVQQSAGVRSS